MIPFIEKNIITICEIIVIVILIVILIYITRRNNAKKEKEEALRKEHMYSDLDNRLQNPSMRNNQKKRKR